MFNYDLDIILYIGSKLQQDNIKQLVKETLMRKVEVEVGIDGQPTSATLVEGAGILHKNKNKVYSIVYIRID